MKRILRGDIYYADLGSGRPGTERSSPWRGIAEQYRQQIQSYSYCCYREAAKVKASSTHVGLSEVFLSILLFFLEQIRTIDKLRLMII